MKRIIVTDSSSNLLGNEPELYNIKVLPLNVIFDNNSKHVFFKDNVDLENAEKFDKLLTDNYKNVISTSFLSINELITVFDELLINYKQVIYMPIDAALSSQYSIVKKWLNTQKKYKNKILLIDTNATGPVLRNIVLKVNELINLPDFDIITICKYIKTLRSQTSAFFIPSSIGFIHKGGRLIHSTIDIIDIIKFKVILKYSLKGIHKFQMSRTFKIACDKALNATIAFHGETTNIDNLIIAYSHGKDIEALKQFAHEMATRKAIKNITFLRLANTVTAHVGPGCIVFIAHGINSVDKDNNDNSEYV